MQAGDMLPLGSIDDIPVPKGVGADGGAADAGPSSGVIKKKTSKVSKNKKFSKQIEKRYETKSKTTSIAVDTSKRVCHEVHSTKWENGELVNDRVEIKSPGVILTTPYYISVSREIFDGGSSTNITPKSVTNSQVVRGRIGGFDGNMKECIYDRGGRGLLKNVLSIPGGKFIIVPGEVRERLGGSYTWIYETGHDGIHCLVRSKRSDPNDPSTLNSEVIAVRSKATNGIEYCTVKLLEMLEIKDFEQPKLHYIVECDSEESGSDISTNDFKIKISKLQENERVDLLKGQTNQEEKCGSKIISINVMDESRTSSQTEVLLKALETIITQCGGRSLLSLWKWKQAGTIQGLEFVTPELIQMAMKKFDVHRAKANFKKISHYSKKLRSSLKDGTPSGSSMFVDAVFLHWKSGSEKTKIIGTDGTTMVLLGVDFTSGYTSGVRMKDQKSYKMHLRKLIKERIKINKASPMAWDLKNLIVDQHACQTMSFLSDILDEFNLNLVPADIGSNDMNKLNRVSGVLNNMTRYWIDWASMRNHWSFEAYFHCIYQFNRLPCTVAGNARGKGFSPFTQMTGAMVSTDMLHAPWGCSCIANPGGKRQGGIDYIFVGVEGTLLKLWNPMNSKNVIKRSHALIIVGKPVVNRIQRIHAGVPVFDADSLVNRVPKPTAMQPGQTYWIRDNSPGKPTDEMFYKFNDKLSKSGEYPTKPIVCGCSSRFSDLKSWRCHIKKKYIKGGNHPDPRKLPKREAAARRRIELNQEFVTTYDERLMIEIKKKIASEDRSGRDVFAWGRLLRKELKKSTPKLPPRKKSARLASQVTGNKVYPRISFSEKTEVVIAEREEFYWKRKIRSRITSAKIWKEVRKQTKRLWKTYEETKTIVLSLNPTRRQMQKGIIDLKKARDMNVEQSRLNALSDVDDMLEKASRTKKTKKNKKKSIQKEKRKRKISETLADELARIEKESVEHTEGFIDATKVNTLRGVGENSTVVPDDYDGATFHEMKASNDKSKKKKKKNDESYKLKNKVLETIGKPRRSARLRITSQLNSLETIDFSEENVKIIRHEACNEMIKFLSSDIICHNRRSREQESEEFVRNPMRGTSDEYYSSLLRGDVNHVNDDLNCKNEEWQNVTSSMDDGCEGFMVNSVKFERVNDDKINELYEIHHGDFEPEENEFWRQNDDYIRIDMLFRESPFGDEQSNNLEAELIEEIMEDKACIRESRGGESKNSVVMDDDYFKNKLQERGIHVKNLTHLKATIAATEINYDPGDQYGIATCVQGNIKDYDYFKNGGIDPGIVGFKAMSLEEKITYVDEIIGESKFEPGDYEDPAPCGIPSFLPVSFNRMLVEQAPTWIDAVDTWQQVTGYNVEFDEHLTYSTPSCEINQCEIRLKPEVLTGLKNMESVETQNWISKLTSANRKRFIVNNSNGALKSPLAAYYIKAMEKEVAGISKLGVAEFVRLPKGKTAIPCRFVFDIKWDNSTDKLVKFKARMVAMGYRQREYNAESGLGSYDPNDISSPVLKTTSLYAILNLASICGMDLITADVGQAFLVARLRTDGPEEVYIQLPPVCEVVDNNVVIRPEVLKWSKSKKKVNVVKLIKSLYGLKNSSQAWFRTIKNFLVEEAGFVQSQEDQCLFTQDSEEGTIILGIHVDDMIVAGTSGAVKTFKKKLNEHFEKEKSVITYGNASDANGVQFLGSVIKKESNGTVTMSQTKRIEDICKRFDINIQGQPGLPYEPGRVSKWQEFISMPHTDDERSRVVSCVQTLYNNKELGVDVKNYDDVVRYYREYTGNLIWVCSAGCPQVLPIVYKLARYQNTPGMEHFRAIRRVMEYLHANRERKLIFGKQGIEARTPDRLSTDPLVIFTDTSHGDCPITKRSTGGYCVFLFGSLLLMRSFRLSCTTTSTTQSEYYMMSAAAAESVYLMELYNNTLLNVINKAMSFKIDRIQKMPIKASKLSQELISTLNSKRFPMISELHPTPLYGDNSSAIHNARNGPGKNSRHSMIHASWLWDLIHKRKIITARKVHTKCNPSDLCTKQEGVSADVFAQHTRVLLGEVDLVKIDISHTLANITSVNNKPVVTSVVHDKESDHFLIVNYDV